MIEVLSRGSGKVFGMKVSGKLLHQDYQQFVPRLERMIEQHGSVRCLVEMTDHFFASRTVRWHRTQFAVN